MKFQYIKDKVSAYFTKGNERSVAVKKNIAVSLVLKCISILVSLQVVPLTIGYVNPTKYRQKRMITNPIKGNKSKVI